MSTNLDWSNAGVMTRSPDEIAGALECLRRGATPLRAAVTAEHALTTELRYVDPARRYILISSSAEAHLNEALLARPSTTFYSITEGLHIEFSAAGPELVKRAGGDLVRMQFPHVMATVQRRGAERRAASFGVSIPVVADAEGLASFDAHMVDISATGLGFVHYAADITLEPGTILRGCRLEIPDEPPIVVDMEVRYSCPVGAAGEGPAKRSGCRFVNVRADTKAALARVFAQALAAS